jgi:hypothetical protein
LNALYKLAAVSSRKAYDEFISIGTTQFNQSFGTYQGETIQILSFAGTNQKGDWIANLNPLSKHGIKSAAVSAAQKVATQIKLSHDVEKLLVCGHSKGGLEAIAFKKLFGADMCVAFAPARGLRYWTNRYMPNTTIFIDPDDVVSKLGFIGFGHPICKRILAPDDHVGINIGDHFMDRWVDFVNHMK